MPPMTVLLTDTTDLIGLRAGYFLEQARGFTAVTAFTDMSITGLILITVMLDRWSERFNHFHGNEARDGRGNVGEAGHEGKAEHALPGYRGGGHAGGHGGG